MPENSFRVVLLQNIVKRFGEFVAIHDATLEIRRGEIHALVGENGAGKSTLMNILYGLLKQDDGTVRVNEEHVDFRNPEDAIRSGVGMVHQHFKLAPSFTVTENIILGAEPLKSFHRVDRKRAEQETLDLSRKFGLDLDPRAMVGSLSVGLRQRVEILKALYRHAQILILDEPTAVLTPQETREMFTTMRALAKSGHSIIFITHKLREVLDVSDRISVMRQGRIVETMDNENVTADQIASLMVGRSVLLRVAKEKAKPGDSRRLIVRNLTARGERGEAAISNLSLDIFSHEIVGLAGVQGNGQDELVECIAGLRRPVEGAIEICGTAAGGDPLSNRKAGLAYIPADRGGIGLSLLSPIWENMTVGHLDEFTKGGFLDNAKAKARSSALIKRFDVRGADLQKCSGALSGGNQQKVQVARELTRDAALIIAEQPSQGVDIGAIEAIHRILVEMRDRGCGVFVVSADLDEIFAISDRILVIYRGSIVADFTTSKTNPEEVGRFMGGLEEVLPSTQDTVEEAANVH